MLMSTEWTMKAANENKRHLQTIKRIEEQLERENKLHAENMAIIKRNLAVARAMESAELIKIIERFDNAFPRKGMFTFYEEMEIIDTLSVEDFEFLRAMGQLQVCGVDDNDGCMYYLPIWR